MVLLDSRGNRGYRPLAATMAGAGLRVGEAIALSWRDVNLATGSLRVADAKTEAGVRTVDLPVGLAAELRALKARSSKTTAIDPVFLSRDGARQTSRNAQARLKPAIKVANIKLVQRGIEPLAENVTPHSLRRTYASMRFALGDDPVYVAAQLGHTKAGFSMRVYARAVSRRQRLAGNHLVEFERALDWARMGTNEFFPSSQPEPAPII